MSTHTWTAEGEQYEARRDGTLLALQRNGRPYYFGASGASSPPDVLLSELLSLAERERWVPVEERLPEQEGKSVLVWRAEPGRPETGYKNIAWRQYGQWSPGASPVTHWRELPPGPK